MKNKAASKEHSPSKKTAAKTIFAAFKILKSEGGQLPGREVIDRIEKSLKFDPWEQEIYKKTGYTRWKSILHFVTVDCAKAGFMRKSKGVWYLTKEGEDAMKLGEIQLLEAAIASYKKWAENNKTKEDDAGVSDSEVVVNVSQVQQAQLESLEEQAIEGIKQFINNKNPYEFQDLVAALLRAMGYYTPFISPKGKDGGIDIIAYQDPLGVKTPRIKVQIKHRPDAAIPSDSIKSLKGLINNGEEVGLFVTSGRFSNDSEKFAREANAHIKLINGEEFISLWQEHYINMPDDSKNLLPLHAIYFLGSNE